MFQPIHRTIADEGLLQTIKHMVRVTRMPLHRTGNRRTTRLPPVKIIFGQHCLWAKQFNHHPVTDDGWFVADEKMERLKVSYSMPVGRGRVRLLMRRPYRILDSRRFGLRMIGRLLALSAPCVFPLRLCASVCLRSVTKMVSKLFVARLWLFSSESRKCSTSKTSAEVTVDKVSESATDDLFIRLLSDFKWRNKHSVLYTVGLLSFSSCLTLWLELRLNSYHPQSNRENGSTDRQNLITLLCCASICSPVSRKYFQHKILQER